MRNIPVALTIAGSDSGGGAGIQADLKAFSAHRVYGTSVITALTAQNTLGVTGIHDVPASFIAEQIDAVFSDIKIDAVKIGMLSQVPVIEAVAAGLKRHGASKIVLDPVMVATSGDLLLAEEAVEAIRDVLFPVADLVTPNLHEAAKLAEMELAQSPAEMSEQGSHLIELGAKAALMKGGHGGEDKASDLLVSDEGEIWFHADRVETANTHGTGCSLSSAIAARLAHGDTLEDAISASKTWLTSALTASDQLEVGRGAGPVHHFHELWRD